MPVIRQGIRLPHKTEIRGAAAKIITRKALETNTTKAKSITKKILQTKRKKYRKY